MADTIFWVLSGIIVVAVVIYVAIKRKGMKEEKPAASEAPPTEGPEVQSNSVTKKAAQNEAAFFILTSVKWGQLYFKI